MQKTSEMIGGLKGPDQTPVTVVIFGATGDLARMKLFPALGALLRKGTLHPDSAIIAIGRREFSDASFKQWLLKQTSSTHVHKDIEGLPIRYFRADVTVPGALAGLPLFLRDHEGKRRCNRIYYLALNYDLFDNVVSQLKEHDLHSHHTCFRRVIFEKPFGNNLRSSNAIDACIHKVFLERDVYRIDHYLGKETVQNLLILRFANPLFERIWNRNFIDRITITVDESEGVGTRFGYYDGTGALRDMIQNHLLQVASLVLMDAPKSMETEHVHDAKVRILKTLGIRAKKDVVFGQYQSYAKEAQAFGIGKTKAETFAAVRPFSTHPRWNEIPIILKSGKKLQRRAGSIIVDFKKKPCMFYCSPTTVPNRLIINIQPDQNILLEMATKKPGEDFNPERVSLEFCHDCYFGPSSAESYERLLYDAIKGDKTLFTRFDELRESWRIVDKVGALGSRIPLVTYADGGAGPKNSF